MLAKNDIAYAVALSMKYSFTPATVYQIATLSLATSAIIAEEIGDRLPFHTIVRTMTDIIGKDLAQQGSLSNLDIN